MGVRVLTVAALALAAAGCGKLAAPPVAVAAADVEQKLYFAHDLDGRRVTLEGYINFDNGDDGRGIAIGQQLTSAPNGAGELLMHLNLASGTGPNQLNLPVVSQREIVPGGPQVVTFDVSKATFQDSAGASHPLGDRVRVTGRLEYETVRNYLMSDAEARSPSGRRYKPHLTGLTLEAAAP